MLLASGTTESPHLCNYPIIHRVWPAKAATTKGSKSSALSTITLADGVRNALIVAPIVIQQLGIKTTSAVTANVPIEIKLPGSLTLDATQLDQVRRRFEGEIVEIGTSTDGSRSLQFGDAVSPGQLLAVVWSRELGEKKCELVDALSQQRLDTATRERLAAIVGLSA